MNKIKVLNVIPSLLDGGIESQLPRLYSKLGNKKYDFHVFCLGNIEKGFAYKRFSDLGCKIELFGFVNVNRKFYHNFWNFYQLLKLFARISHHRFGVINSHDFFSATMTRLAVVIARFVFYKPRMNIVTLHNMQYWLKWYHHFINKALSFVTDKIICVSKSVFDFSRNRDKIKGEKYILVMNGIDTEAFKYSEDIYKKSRSAEGFNKEDFLIGHVGSFSVRKGQPYLVKAFLEILPFRDNLKLILVGGFRKHEPQIFEEVNDLIIKNNAEKYIKILSTRNEIVQIYNMFDLFVMPSTVEGFGLALAEAMSCEKITIASNIPPFREIIDDGINGFLFETENYKSLAKVMDYVISNFKDLGYISKNARNRIVSNFGDQKMIQIYDDLYSS